MGGQTGPRLGKNLPGGERDTQREGGKKGRREGEKERADPEDDIPVPALYLSEGELPILPSPPIPLLLPDTDCCRLAVVL